MRIRELLAVLALMGACQVAAQSHYELHHPDVLHRERGLAALEDGEFGDAMEEFKRSAFFADKGSQAMIAEMYWSGQGVSEDRVLAYIWMDLAAERGYPLMIGKRESYWNALSSAEQQRAVTEDRNVFDEFADHVAKPRLEAILRSGKRQSPGSRVGGSSAFVDVYTEISRTSLRGEAQGTYRPQYYAARYWNPRSYWEHVDLAWAKPPQGVVEVLPLSTLDKDGAGEPGQQDDKKQKPDH